jgi:hypothetical protein
MRSTAPTQPRCKRQYKKLLQQVRKLQQSSGHNAYRRATLLNSVYEDPDFRADNEILDNNKLLAILDEYVSDLCLTFSELRMMLNHYPEEYQWKDGKLRDMYNGMLAKTKSDVPPRRRRAKPADPYKEARKVKASMQAVQDQLLARIKTLEAENEALRAQIAELQAKIIELEAN